MAMTQSDVDAILEGKLSPQAAQIPRTVLTDEQKKEIAAQPRPSDSSILPAAGGIVGAVATQFPQTRMANAALQVASKFPAAIQPYIASLFGSTIGTAGGTIAEQALERDIDPAELAKNLAENAVWDAAGNLVFSFGGKVIKLGKDATGLSKDTIPDANRAAQEFLAQRGGSLTKGQLTEGGVTQAVERAVREVPGASSDFKRLDTLNKAALEKGKKEYLDTLSNSPNFQAAVASGDPTRLAVGDNIQAAITSAREDVSKAFDPFYSQVLPQGGNFSVDLTGAANRAKAQATSIASRYTTGTAIDAEVANTLKKIQSINPNQTFAQAQATRSDLLALKRKLEGADQKPTQAIKIISDAIDDVTKSMDSAATKLNPQLAQQYKATQTAYKEAIDGLYSDTLTAVMTKRPEDVGAFIFDTATPSAFRDFYKGLAQVQKYYPNANATQIIDDVKAGFVQSMMSTPEKMAKFSNQLIADPEFKKSFGKLFSNPTERKFLETMSTAARVSGQEQTSLTLLSQGVRAGAGIAGTTLAGAAGYIVLPQEAQDRLTGSLTNLVAAGGGLILTPKLIAKSLTNPKAQNALIGLTKADKLGGAAVAKLVSELNKSGVIDNEYITAVQKTYETSFGFAERGSRQPVPTAPMMTQDMIDQVLRNR